MIKFIQSLFGDSNARALKQLWPQVAEINEYAEEYASLSEEALRAKTDEFKAEIHDAVADIEARIQEIRDALRGIVSDAGGDGQAGDEELSFEDRQDLIDELDDLEAEWLEVVDDALDALMTRAFAVVKEACRRLKGRQWEAGGATITWDMVPYDVQLLGGIVLHQGNVAEMKTGEGKTLVAVAPVYLNALPGRGVHLVTVNPYLAQRDAEWMGPVFEYLGLSVDCIENYEPHTDGRKSAYRADITYGTNNEFGFDYLRDNSFVVDPDQLVQREHHYAIVDEVDSVLIDEARTPLIISGPVPQANDARFGELNPAVSRVVRQQINIVAGFATEAENKLKERDKALEAGDNKLAGKMEEEAGLALLRASRGFPKNRKLVRLMQEPGVAQLLQRTEFFYLQDNAKNMPFVDDALHYALDEKQHAIELTGQGREAISGAAGEDADLFILPDIGEESAKIEQVRKSKLQALEAELRDDDSLTEEQKQTRLDEALDAFKNEEDEAKRQLYSTYSERAERLHAIEQLLKAYTLYEKDIEYIVQEGKVQIVDKHTGRVLPGRRYSDGLHQAIEAKEGVKVQAATQTYATITLQNYFRMYHKLAGMTGTAETEAEELHKIYGVSVIVVPTNRPIARDDKDDLVYRTRREKYNAVINHIQEYHHKGQPVLVGTTSVEVSETLSRMLKRSGIPHNVLNARRDRALQESQIVAEAGKRGAVTIATNMAGRGTDIKLGEGVLDLGGLAILGTERHESRRIDLQLRGRSGRQGDPGESQFYISLEDNLMRLFMSDRVAKVMDKIGGDEDEPIIHPWITKSIERAQKKVEQNNFGIRKRQLEYDDVLNAQREVIYDRRMHALTGNRFHGEFLEMLRDVIRNIVEKYYGEGQIDEMREELRRTLAFDLELERELFVNLGEDGVTDRAFEAALAFYKRKRAALAQPFFDSMQSLMNNPSVENKPTRVSVDFSDGARAQRTIVKVDDVLNSQGREVNDALERTAMLSYIDQRWTEHLRHLDEVKEGVGLRAYGQRDPLVEYKMEAFKLFSEMLTEINNDVVSFVMRAGPLVNQAPKAATAQRSRVDRRRIVEQHNTDTGYGVKAGGSSQAESGADRDPTVVKKPVTVDKIGRNDMVTIQNPTTGMVQTLKYKYAEKKIAQGWSVISKD